MSPAVALVAGFGVVVAAVAIVARVRWSVAVPAGVAGMAGAWVGAAIVRTLCAPGDCRLAETMGGLVTGLGALVGVGLVLALVARSFEEYRAGSTPPPTEPGS